MVHTLTKTPNLTFFFKVNIPGEFKEITLLVREVAELGSSRKKFRGLSLTISMTNS